MTDASDDIVLELRNLYVGYYKDLNILQDLNVKARKKPINRCVEVILKDHAVWSRFVDSRARRISKEV